jgi:hypothetical protein
MKNVVYKFLDEYIGTELVSCYSTPNRLSIKVISKKNEDKELIHFVCDGEKVVSDYICAGTIQVISDYCCITVEESLHYIRGWINVRFNIGDKQDLIKFVPKEN